MERKRDGEVISSCSNTMISLVPFLIGLNTVLMQHPYHETEQKTRIYQRMYRISDGKERVWNFWGTWSDGGGTGGGKEQVERGSWGREGAIGQIRTGKELR